jgi:RNA polymerase sigma-70 factor (ECF subfamily)
MEGDAMSAVLEAPVLSADEEGCETSTDVLVPHKGLAFTDNSSGDSEGRFSEACFADRRAVRRRSGGSHEAGLGPQREAEISAATEQAAAEYSCVPTESGALPMSPPLMKEEFDSLYQTYARRVYRQCYRMLGNQEDAEDLTQEVFLQLFRKASTFRGESSFSTWLHRLTINTVLMQMRRFRRWRGSVTSLDAVTVSDDGANEFPAAASLVPAPATSPMAKITLDVAIGKLSSGYKEIFLLHDQEGYRHDEIARLLGISEGTSKSQLHKARLRLRHLVGGDRAQAESSASPTRNRRAKRCRFSYPASALRSA